MIFIPPSPTFLYIWECDRILKIIAQDYTKCCYVFVFKKIIIKNRKTSNFYDPIDLKSVNSPQKEGK